MIETEAYQLGELCTLVSRGITPRYTENIENSCIILNQRCIRDYQINSDNARMHDLSKRRISTDKILKTFDVLVNSTGVGTLGRVAQYLSTKNQMISVDSHVTIIRPNIQKIDALYFGYLIKSKQSIIENLGQGSTGQTELSKEAIKELSVLVIKDKNIQNNISNFLLNIDNKITLNTQTNQTLEQIAQAIFKHWFIDFAPVHAKANALARGETTEQAELAAMACLSGKTAEKITALKAQDPTAYQQLQQTAQAFPSEFVETEMGQVPKGWEVLKFKDFVKETKEKVGKLQGIEEYSVGNEGIYPRKEKYKKQLAKDPSKNKLIREANIVFGMGNKEVNWGIMRDKIGSVSSAYNIFQINDINHLFLDMFINNIPYYFRDIIKPTSRQGQTIDKEAFLEKAIYYPNKEIINIFLEKITQINELSICIKSQNIYLLSIRDYLLPKLLGGEIKL
ncbi:restriction endonuclease subunit S [Gallibacterium anatis]|uniref:restriction endonuclease subunit S n=1 Tax=Gallibacterium anatis TaxID=750 RepID=UPI003005640C